MQEVYQRYYPESYPIFRYFPGSRGYDRKWLRFDLLAGLTLAAFAIPDGMAYASLAWLLLDYGLYVSIVAPLLYFLFATSRQAVVGAGSSEAILLASVLAVVALGDPYRISCWHRIPLSLSVLLLWLPGYSGWDF